MPSSTTERRGPQRSPTFVVYVNGRFLTQRLTGVQRFAHEVLHAMDRQIVAGGGGDLAWTVLAPPGTRPPDLSAMSFQCVGGLHGHAWEQWSLPRAVGSSWLLSFGASGPWTKRNQIVTVHDAGVCAVPEAYSLPFRAFYRLTLPILLSRLRRVVTVSEFSRGELVSRFGVARASVCISGEGYEHILRVAGDPGILAKHGLAPQGYVLAVGSLAAHKNLEVVAEAARRMQGSSVRFVVAGAANPEVFGSPRGAREARVTSLGPVSDAELRALYENALAFVFPSVYEGFGLPPLEAMALGCPVIASNRAAIPETCGNAALYFEPTRPDELASLIQQLATDPQVRAALVLRGRERLLVHGWDRAASRYLRALHELVISSPQSRGARPGLTEPTMAPSERSSPLGGRLGVGSPKVVSAPRSFNEP